MSIVVVVTGARNYGNRAAVFSKLDEVHEARRIRLLIEGGATGADRLARKWAKARGVAYRTVNAAWEDVYRPGAVVRTRKDGSRYDAAAGGIRNQKMADLAAQLQPSLCVPFPGGTGTADMLERVRRAGVEVAA